MKYNCTDYIYGLFEFYMIGVYFLCYKVYEFLNTKIVFHISNVFIRNVGFLYSG